MTKERQPAFANGKLVRHEDQFVVVNGKIVYDVFRDRRPKRDALKDRAIFTLEEFKQAVIRVSEKDQPKLNDR